MKFTIQCSANLLLVSLKEINHIIRRSERQQEAILKHKDWLETFSLEAFSIHLRMMTQYLLKSAVAH